MKLSEIKSPVSALPGVGPAAVKLFARLNIFTVAELLQFYPRDYEDRRRRVPIDGFERAKVHTVAQVTAHEWFGYGKMRTLKVVVSDGTASAALIAFNRKFFQNSLPVGSIVAVTGNFSVKYGQIQAASFDVVKLADSGAVGDFDGAPLPDSGILPLYALTEGLSQKNVRKAVAAAVSRYVRGIEDEIPKEIINSRGLLSKQDAVRLIHQPESPNEINEARRTLIYEELFQFQCVMAERAWRHKGAIPAADVDAEDAAPDDSSVPFVQEDDAVAAFVAELSPLQRGLYGRLGFSLTADQRKVISEMNAEIDRGYSERNSLLNGAQGRPPFTMARLLQGDVGSGKTLVAFFACLRAVSWKGQCALMAPTEILARQHAESAARMLEPLGVTVAFLTGNIKAAGRAPLLKALKSGEISIIIGTHALFSSQVVYKDLQLVVIDEQHRFGVVQRQTIINKGRRLDAGGGIALEPHLLMMSATPIPQTLALTVFGDLDVSSIRTMPSGRKPVQTYLVCEGNERNAYNAVRKHLAEGRQAYFVYPAISFESCGGEFSGCGGADAEFRDGGLERHIKSVEEMFQTLSSSVYPEFQCALLHSKIGEEEQVRILSEFRSGKIQVLAATTVIEVGVDVPNATCIVIEQADRFGLAQLHQLRGRVGRGAEQAFCFLVYSKNITRQGIERMKVMRQCTDGFLIASKDLKLRGPGEISGTVQAGNLTLGIADIVRDKDILVQARADAFKFMQNTLQGGASASDGAF